MIDSGEERRLGERVARIEAKVSDLADDVGDLRRELLGPDGRNVRERLHKLETDNAAAKASEAALAVAKSMYDKQWSWRLKLVVALTTAVGTVCVVTTTVVLLIQLAN